MKMMIQMVLLLGQGGHAFGSRDMTKKEILILFCCCLVPLFQLWFVTVELWWWWPIVLLFLFFQNCFLAMRNVMENSN